MTKALRSILFITLASALFAGVSSAQQDTERPPLKVAVVNLQALSQQSRALSEARNEWESIRQRLQEQAENDQEQIRQQAEQLERQRRVLRPEVYEQRLNGLRTQMVQIRQRTQRQREALQQAVQTTLQSFQQEVVTIIQEIAIEQGYTLVLDQGAALHASPAYDITETALDRLNDRVPSLEFEFTDPTAEDGEDGAQE